MGSSTTLADIYSGGYAEIRAQARRRDPAALTAVAKQFEAFFIEQMLKSMRAATPSDPLFGGDDTDLYTEMFDHQVSLEIAKGRGIGFADLIIQQLEGAVGDEADSAPPGPESAVSAPLPRPASLDRAARGRISFPRRSEPVGSSAGAAAPAGGDAGSPPAFGTPGGFVETLRSQAVRAARRLGVSPRLLLAQAALETGWGARMMQYADGRSANNLFGIKADRRWEGPVVSRSSLELVDGVMRPVTSPFRAYPSVGASFDDYVSLIRSDARYLPALARATDPVAYIKALQAAGYATDPNYADKVVRLMRQPVLTGPGVVGDEL